MEHLFGSAADDPLESTNPPVTCKKREGPNTKRRSVSWDQPIHRSPIDDKGMTLSSGEEIRRGTQRVCAGAAVADMRSVLYCGT
jgi:hypothetical protein